MERKIKIILEYDGTDFAGWQNQKNARSVQAVLEEALQQLYCRPVRTYGSGRTDAGVHALGQVVHFTDEGKLKMQNIASGTNYYLPGDVSVVSAEEVPPEFDARRSAILRWYRFTVLNRQTRSAIRRKYSLFVPNKLDLDIISKGLSMLEGDHDFAAFRHIGCDAKRTNLTMQQASMIQDGDYLYFDFKCRSFLYNMIRIIMGVLLESGKKKIPLSVIDQMFEEKKAPVQIPTAGPEGLCLMGVYYPDELVKTKIK